MRTVSRAPGVLAFALAGLAACADTTRPTQPLADRGGGAALASLGAADQRIVNVMDACDSTTFNAAAGPGTCRRPGGVAFPEFLAQIQAHGGAGAWHFAPPDIQTTSGTTLLAVNRGGETHTFTEVEHFGGGIVPLLNDLSGNPVPAPECLALEGDDFIPPGGSYPDTVEAPGTELYQCCIHPWMRTVVHVH